MQLAQVLAWRLLISFVGSTELGLVLQLPGVATHGSVSSAVGAGAWG